MTLYTIVVLACLQADIRECRFHHKPLHASAIPTAAFMQAQSWVAEWQARHPGWDVIRWRMVKGAPA